MSGPAKPFEPPLISCEVCLRQVPRSEARIYEAPDYVLHFCGIDCFSEWQRQQGREPEAGERGKPR